MSSTELPNPVQALSDKTHKLRRALLPSTLPEFQDKQNNYIRDGEATKKYLEEERVYVLRLLQLLRDQRKTKFMKPEPGLNSNDPRISRLEQAPVSSTDAKEYSQTVRTYQTLRSHLQHVDNQLEEVMDKFRTSACHDASGFYGLADWAQYALKTYGDLCNGIGGASIFGAGITYTTIFSGIRGNIGLMCWAFALFDIGFILTLLVRSMLTWFSGLPLPGRQFATTFFWEFAIQTTLILALASTTIAIFLLNLTTYLLIYPSAAGGDRQDSPQWNIGPTPSGIMAMVALAGAVFTVAICLLLSWWSNDFQRSKQRRMMVGTADIFV